LWHQHAGARNAGRDPTQEDVPRPLRSRCEHRFQLRPLLRDDSDGPEPKTSFTKGFFDTAMEQNPKPITVAIVAADAEFSKNAADGARENAKKAGLKIIYDKSYPPSTTDFGPIVRGIQATNPDLVVICSYPLDSVGMVLAANEA